MSDYNHILDNVIAWSRDRNYAGYSKHDALNSSLLSACSMGVPFLRLLLTQVVMRSPVNIRPWLGVPTGRNPKGIGLFAHALWDRSTLRSSGSENDKHEATELLRWLIAHASPDAPASPDVYALFAGDSREAQLSKTRSLKGLGWGYHYPWQDQGFFQPAHYPNRVVTSWIGFAVLRAYEETKDERWLRVCGEIATFLLDNPRILHESADQQCLSYVPLDTIEWAVMDVSALVSAFISWYAACLPDDHPARVSLQARARKLMAFVVDKQTGYGAWFYTWPANDSHIKHDNYHTAIILDCLADYMTHSGDQTWMPVYRKGLTYYREALFTSEGAPRWMNDKTYPHDTHGAASGILAFTRAARMDVEHAEDHIAWADCILTWTLENLYDSRGYFYYQRTRWMTKRFCLMRWCNAWMCRALAQRVRLSDAPSVDQRPPPIAR
jgi:hypothetical protein